MATGRGSATGTTAPARRATAATTATGGPGILKAHARTTAILLAALALGVSGSSETRGATAAIAGAPTSAFDVEILAAALPLGDGSGELAVPVVIQVTLADPRDTAAIGGGQVQLELRDSASGTVRASLAEPFAAGADAAAGNATPGRGVRLYAEFRVPPGVYALDATAKEEGSDRAGHAFVPLRAPQAGAEVWMASPPLMVDERTGWRASRANQNAAQLPFAFVDQDGAAYLPSANAEVGTTEPIVAQALIATPSREFPFVLAEAVSASGAVRQIPANVSGVGPTAYAGVLAVQLALGPIAEPGDYRVRIGLASEDGKLVAASGSEVAVHVRPEKTAARPAPALDLAARGTPLAEGYRKLLRALPDLGIEACAPELAKFELAARDAYATKRVPLAPVREAERAVIEGFDPAVAGEARYAIAALHLSAAAIFRDKGEAALAAESVQFASELLNAAAADADERWKARTADLLSMARPAEALTFDPDHTLAQLRLATLQERGRQLVTAAQTLDHLLKAHPEHAEARLRLGVVLRRSGNGSDARRQLERVVSATAPTPEWILELAYSELAGIEHDADRGADAERWLRLGIARLESQLLHLQLALYLDRSNRGAEATAVVNRMPVARADGRAAARHLYARESVEETAAAKQRIATAIDAALPALRRAVGGSTDRGAGR